MGIVHVRHPAPLRYVAKGGSRERRDYVRLVTPAELREVAPEAVRHVTTLDGSVPATLGIPYFEFEGRLWTAMEAVENRQAYRLGRPFGRDDLVRLLEASTQLNFSATDVMSLLRGTPVASCLGPRWDQFFYRGSEPDDLKIGQVIEDGSERARAGLRRFLERDVLLAGDRVLVHAPGPLLAHPGHKPQEDFLIYPYAMHNWEYRLACRIDRLNEFWRFERQHHPAVSRRRREIWLCTVPAEADDFPPELLEDDDILRLVNCLPRMLVDAARMALEKRPDRGAVLPGGLSEGLAAMRSHTAWGLIGGNGLDRAEGILALALDVAQGLRGLCGPEAVPVELHMALSFAEEIALPRLHAIAPEDEHAFEAIGPGL